MSPRESIEGLRAAVQARVLGQDTVVELLLLGLLSDGHVLLEGLPGLAKTRAVKALAAGLDAQMRRVQFTPDLLPSDVTGTVVYQPEAPGSKGQTDLFRFEPGPLFGNLVLVDEVNRAPAKVQSALLEAMEERQVTVAGETHALPELFMVLATQNPIEQEGTYPLPEAQLDRFLLHVRVDYPSKAAELDILRLVRKEETTGTAKSRESKSNESNSNAAMNNAAKSGVGAAASAPARLQGSVASSVVLEARAAIREGVAVAEAVERYIVDLVTATRAPGALDGDLARWIEVGASPRACIALDRVARSRAWLQGRDYVTADDVRAVASPVLRHRLLLAYGAKANGVTPDQVVGRLLDVVAVAG